MKIFASIVFRARILWICVSHWEYWNSNILYLPVLPYLAWLWIRQKSFFFFNAANPGIQNGGFLMESKWAIDQSAPANFFPATLLVSPGDEIEKVFKMAVTAFPFPFIAKPDIGGKGQGVAIINDKKTLALYHDSCPVPYLLQEKITYPLEAGIFYVRMPNAQSGILTGIVEKGFVTVTGDGVSTVRELLTANPRYLLQIKSLENIIERRKMLEVLPQGVSALMVDIGNHARGSYFVNASFRINDRLTTVIDKCCKDFPGFYYGRLDIRFRSWELLEQGSAFSIIELNGSGSEPTHIYDPANSIWYAWKEVCRHWRWMARISKYNHQNGVAYLSFHEGIKMFRQHLGYANKMKGFNFKPCAQMQAEPEGKETGKLLTQPVLFHDP